MSNYTESSQARVDTKKDKTSSKNDDGLTRVNAPGLPVSSF